MIGAFWIFVFMVVVGIVLYIFELIWRRRHRASENNAREEVKAPEVGEESYAVNAPERQGEDAETVGQGADSGECCGLHLVCEKDSLSPMSDEILYYDDEELDRFVGRAGDSYSPEETEEFRDVLMTLRPEDVSGWARSITQRRLELPPEVRDELLMLVNEQRQSSRR